MRTVMMGQSHDETALCRNGRRPHQMAGALRGIGGAWLLLSYVFCSAAGAAVDIDKYLGKRWYGIYFMDQKVGYAEAEISKGWHKGKPAILVGLTLNANAAMAGTPQQMTIVERRTYLQGAGLVSFRTESRTGGGTMRITGEIKDGKMEIATSVGGREVRSVGEAPREKFEDYIAEERLVGKGQKVGDEITFSQYQPTLQKTITAVSRIKEIQEKQMQGVPGKIYVVETTIKEMGITSVSLLNSTGELLQAQVAGAFTMRLEDEKTAQNIDYRSDLVLSTVIRPGKPIKNPSAVRQMKAFVTGVKDKALLISSERQVYVEKPGGGWELTVTREDLSGATPIKLPLPKTEFSDALSPSLFVQSDSPAIIEKAQSIIGAEQDALKVSDILVDWVYRNLKKNFSATFSNALDVLASGKGDCTEHSVFYVALARAAGLPAREVSGLVYSSGDDGFYYHQWAEVYVGKWIAVDPTFGQHQADATHIKFASGGLMSSARLLNLVGSIGLRVLSCEYGPKK